MARLSVFLALLLVGLVALAEATTYTITTTTIEEDVANPRGRGSQERCREQIQRQQQLRNCQRYLQQSQYGGYESLRMVVNPERGEEIRGLRQCCQELQNIEEDCQCEAIRQVVRQQQQQQRGGREMEMRAEELPRRCNLQTREQCRIRSGWF